MNRFSHYHPPDYVGPAIIVLGIAIVAILVLAYYG